MKNIADTHVADEEFLQFSGGSPKAENPVVRDNIIAALSTMPLAQYTTQEEQLQTFDIDPRQIVRALRADVPEQLPVANEQLKMILTAGASGAIDLTFRYWSWIWNQFQEKCEIIPRPTVIMAAPAYGMLVELAAIHGLDVEFLPLQEDNGWRFSAATLDDCLRKMYKERNAFPIGLLDVSPHNPTGRLRMKQTAFENYNALHRTSRTRGEWLRSLPSERSYYELMAHNQNFNYAANFLARPKILDDLAYMGLEHGKKSGTPYLALADKDSEIVEDVFTVASTSKSGSAAVRAGLLLIDKRHYPTLMYMIYRATDAPSPVVAPTLEAVFSMADKFTTRRDPYMSNRRNELRRTSLLARVLVNGTEETNVKNRDSSWLKKELTHFGLGDSVPPIPHVKILPPGDDAGMFHLIEFEGNYWKKIVEVYSYARNSYNYVDELTYLLSERMKMYFLPPQRTFIDKIPGNEDRLVFRMRHDMDPKYLVAMAQRLHQFIANNPERDIETALKARPEVITLDLGDWSLSDTAIRLAPIPRSATNFKRLKPERIEVI